MKDNENPAIKILALQLATVIKLGKNPHDKRRQNDENDMQAHLLSEGGGRGKRTQETAPLNERRLDGQRRDMESRPSGAVA